MLEPLGWSGKGGVGAPCLRGCSPQRKERIARNVGRYPEGSSLWGRPGLPPSWRPEAAGLLALPPSPRFDADLRRAPSPSSAFQSEGKARSKPSAAAPPGWVLACGRSHRQTGEQDTGEAGRGGAEAWNVQGAPDRSLSTDSLRKAVVCW